MEKPEVTANVERKFRRKISKIATIGFFLFLVLGAGFATYYFKFATVSTTTQVQRTAKVTKGEISSSVSGSGPIVSSNKNDITSRVGATINKVYYKEGERAKAGSLLFELDDTDAAANVQKINENISQTQLSSSTTLSNINKLDIVAPFDGQVTNITSKVGDTASKGAGLLTLTDTSKLKVQIPFNLSSINSLKSGQKATIYIAELMQSTSGTISYVTDKGYASANGGQVISVLIEIDNPGSLTAGMKVSAEVITSDGKQTSTEYGTLDYINKTILKSDSGGEILSINAKENQYVKRGTILVSIKNTDLELTRETNNSKLHDLDVQLAAAKKTLDNYKIYAPFDGLITKQTLVAGDFVKSGDVLSSISNYDHMEFSVSLDELDIAKIQVGQKANVTIEALTETLRKPISGTVNKIAIEGTTSNGVTTYPVTISLDDNKNVKLGMNASAEIVVSKKTDVLMIPIEAVQKMGNRTMVMKKVDATTFANMQKSMQQRAANMSSGNGNNNRNNNNNSGNESSSSSGQRSQRVRGQNSSNPNNQAQSGNNWQTSNNQNQNSARGATGNTQQNPYYNNSIRQSIEVGVNNEAYIEVISGLNEGDEGVLPPVSTTSATATNANANARQGGTGFGMPGIGGGGMGGGAMGGGGNFGGGGNNNRARGN